MTINKETCFKNNIIINKYLTAPDDPPIDCSTILAIDKTRSAGVCTGRFGLSFFPSSFNISKLQIFLNSEFMIYIV